MSETLRGGVIGAGVFGGYHARQYARLPGVTLSAVGSHHEGVSTLDLAG
jgi:predicted homoserine dehydrogenase-like protein